MIKNIFYCHSRPASPYRGTGQAPYGVNSSGNPSAYSYPWDPRFREDDRKKRRDDKGQKYLVVCRELTKKFETIYRGTAEEILEKIKSDFPNEKPLGEFVVVAH